MVALSFLGSTPANRATPDRCFSNVPNVTAGLVPNVMAGLVPAISRQFWHAAAAGIMSFFRTPDISLNFLLEPMLVL
jgi:predicted anti-sigma-YlaC factor YlaD